jgi:hypothetical protein
VSATRRLDGLGGAGQRDDGAQVVVEAEGASSRPASAIATAAPSSTPTFVPLALPQAQDLRDIRIELQRGNVRVTLQWPCESAADCASWMRELRR